MRQLIANFAGAIPYLLVSGTIALVGAARALVLDSPRKAAIIAGIYTIFAITLVALWPHGQVNPRKLQLVPFADLVDLFRDPGVRYSIMLPNLLLFVPFGVIAPVAWPSRLNHLGKLAAAAAVFSLALEITQFIIGGHESSVNDIILNTAGAAGGYCLLLVVRKVFLRLSPRRA